MTVFYLAGDWGISFVADTIQEIGIIRLFQRT